MKSNYLQYYNSEANPKISARSQLSPENYIRFLYHYYNYTYLSDNQIQGLLKIKNLKNKLLQSERKNTLDHFKTLEIQKRSTASFNSHLKVFYYGDIGTSGYAHAAVDYSLAFILSGSKFSFRPCQGVIQELNKKQQIVYPTFNINFIPDIVIIHTLPSEYWHLIAKIYKQLNPKIKIVGLTVWEANPIPYEWKIYIEACDLLLVPSDWNRQAFQDAYLKIPVKTLHNPIGFIEKPLKNFKLENSRDFDDLNHISSNTYLFYTIGDWIRRKNIPILIEAFVKTFKPSQNVALFIKTTPRFKINLFRQKIQAYRSLGHKIFINTDFWSEKQIMSLHSRGNCFVSTCKSEGTSLAACEAAYLGKPVLITSGSGQNEYLKGCFYISAIEEAPNMCDTLDPKHKKCGEKCLYFPAFNSTQRWMTPVRRDLEEQLELIYKTKAKANPYTKSYIKEFMSYEKIAHKISKILIFI